MLSLLSSRWVGRSNCILSVHSILFVGSRSDTLQGFLVRPGQQNPDRHLYMVDESSLASTKQVRDFLAKLGSSDRVLLIGDTCQHQGVEAGKPFALRRSFASLLLSEGASLRVSMELMRHSTPEMTLGTYAQIVGEEKREASSKVALRVFPKAKVA